VIITKHSVYLTFVSELEASGFRFRAFNWPLGYEQANDR